MPTACPVTLTNTGNINSSLTITSLTIAGGNSGDFGLTHNCPGTLAAGDSCTLSPAFTPTAAGPRKSSITISNNAGGSPQIVILTGVGTVVSVPESLPFSTQTVGTSSTKTITVTNKGSGTLHLYQIAITGTNAGDFSKTTTCGSTLGIGAGSSCTVSVTFKPTATGTRTASVLFSDDGGGSPQAVSLAGTGI